MTKVFRRNKARTDVAKGVPTPPPKMAWECEHADKRAWARGRCKSCYNKWLIANNPEYAAAQKANVANWIEKNYARYRAKNKQWRAKQAPEYGRIRLLARYGMTLDDYDKMLAGQKGACAICGESSRRTLHVDHCHRTGVVRGLLCFRCNYGMSYFSDDIQRFARIVRYLRDAEKHGTLIDDRPRT